MPWSWINELLPLWYICKSLPVPKITLLLSTNFKLLPVISKEPVNLCVSVFVSPNIVEPSENEVVTCVTVDFTI